MWRSWRERGSLLICIVDTNAAMITSIPSLINWSCKRRIEKRGKNTFSLQFFTNERLNKTRKTVFKQKKYKLYTWALSHPWHSTDDPQIICSVAFRPFDESGEGWLLRLSYVIVPASRGNSRSKSDLCQHKPWKVKSLVRWMCLLLPSVH